MSAAYNSFISFSHRQLLQLLLSRLSRVLLCNPIDGSPPGSSVPGILQARMLEWVAISFSNACMHAKSLQSCPTLCTPMDRSPPGSSVHRVLQARILEGVAISFSLTVTISLDEKPFPVFTCILLTTNSSLAFLCVCCGKSVHYP